MISRDLAKTIKKEQWDGFINLIYGPRRVGKTVLLKQLTKGIKPQTMAWFDGDELEFRDQLSSTSGTVLADLVKNKQVIVVDEAQRIPNIGLSLKIMVDKFPKKIFYVTGSSSLALSRGIQESLTGRNKTYRLFPLSFREQTAAVPDYQKGFGLEKQIIYGGYPFLTELNTDKKRQQYLANLVRDYLFKDLFYLQDIDKPEILRKLAMLLAFQVGATVSLNELAVNLKTSVATISRYLELLKQSFVIYELTSYSTNLRKELAKAKKYYFWDTGIRNALIGQFQSLDIRPDKGALWENFLGLERIKKHEYDRDLINYYFWRSYQKAEIDWLEESKGKLKAYEFKWQKAAGKTPLAFEKAYNTKVISISKENYQDFI